MTGKVKHEESRKSDDVDGWRMEAREETADSRPENAAPEIVRHRKRPVDDTHKHGIA